MRSRLCASTSTHDQECTRVRLCAFKSAYKYVYAWPLTTATCIYVCSRLLLRTTTSTHNNLNVQRRINVVATRHTCSSWRGAYLECDMFATCLGITPSLPSRNPNASQIGERLFQLTRTDGRTTRTTRHDDNPGRHHDLLMSYDSFWKAMIAVYKDLDKRSNAEDKLEKLCQTGSMAN